MKREIRVFNSFEEQEQFYTDKMLASTPLERFQNLFRMQQLTQLLHPTANKNRKIIIKKNGYTQ